MYAQLQRLEKQPSELASIADAVMNDDGEPVESVTADVVRWVVDAIGSSDWMMDHQEWAIRYKCGHEQTIISPPATLQKHSEPRHFELCPACKAKQKRDV